MTDPTFPDRPGDGVDSALETLLALRPFLEPILRPVAAVCRGKAMLVDALSGEGTPCPIAADDSRLGMGVPLCDGSNVRLLKGPIRRCLPPMLDVLERSIPGFDRRGAGYAEPADGPDPAALAAALLDGNGGAVAEAAGSAGADAWMLDLAVRTALSPVLGWVAASCRRELDRADWKDGRCPVCGAMPSVSCIAKAQDPGSEYLTGAGGKRFLHCSLCGFEWSVSRTMCPACGSDGNSGRMHYEAAGFEHERVEVCLECRRYVTCIDLRQVVTAPPMDIAAAGMLHLDVWAAEKGFQPLAPTPWNRV